MRDNVLTDGRELYQEASKGDHATHAAGPKPIPLAEMGKQAREEEGISCLQIFPKP